MSKSKTDDILAHLLAYGTITSLEAIDLYSATRLSAIIFNLKKKGYSISSTNKPFVDKHGNKSFYAEYELLSSPAQSEDKDKTYDEKVDDCIKLMKGETHG